MTWSKLGTVVLAAAGVLACGVAREIEGPPSDPAAGPVVVGCAMCHGDPARTGPALSKAAPDQGAHLAHLAQKVACSTCHAVPTSTSHSNGLVEVVLGGGAALGGAQPAFAAGTCSGVYCHGATLGAGGRRTTVAWTDGPLACDACHAAPPPSHASSSTTCSSCHPGTVKADGTIDVAGGLHVNGATDLGGGSGATHAQNWADPANHGLAAKRDLGSCQGCHGISFDGGSAGVSCNACHGGTAWMSNCTFCHGTKLATYTAGDLGKAAPPRGTAGQTASTDPAVGAHQKHLSGGSLGPAVACAECHAVPTDLSHLDGTPEVTFGPAASRDGATPAWNGATCAAYCHGATLAGGTNKTPSWTGGAGQVACGTCHGAPPPAPHTTSTSCGSCHDGYTDTTVNAALHMDGNVDAPAGAAHAAGWAAKEQHGYTVNRTGLASCKTCHGASLTGGGGPSCATCHAGGSAWATSCTFCHGTGTNPAPPVDTQGLSLTTNVSVGAHASHLGTTWMAKPACTACHPDRTSSNVITDAAHIDGNGVAEVQFGTLARTGGVVPTYTRASATSATCATYCHGATLLGGTTTTPNWTSTVQATCTSCHGIAPSSGRHSKHSGKASCTDCHGTGYSSSTVVAATHVDGLKQVGGISGWNATSRSCSNSCHGSKVW